MSRGDLQLRDLRIILKLANARGWVTTKQLAEHFDIEQRTVQRIIKAMEEIPLPIQRDPVGGGVRLESGFSIDIALPTNLLEVAALQIARDRIRIAAAETLIGEAFEQLSDRALKQLRSEHRAICERFVRMYQGETKTTAGSASPIAHVIHKGLDEHKVVLIEYVSPNEQRPKKRAIEPMAIWVSAERAYLLAFDRQRGTERTYAIDRVKGALLTNELFSPRVVESAEYFKHAIGAFVGTSSTAIDLRLDAEAVRRMGKKTPRNSRLVARPDGGANLHWTVPLSDELLAWMVTLGPGVAVTAPTDAIEFVRDAFRTRADAQPKPQQKRKRSETVKKRTIALPGPLARGPSRQKKG